MGWIAVVFAGQGAQHTGMGKELYDASPAARSVFKMAERIRPGTLRQCFDGTKRELSETVNTQPCVFAVDLACAAALREAGVKANGAAGFSLGEIAGLAFTGILSEEDAFRLVCRRAELMEQCSRNRPGSMAAVLGLENEKAEDVCKKAGVWPVNYNCPGQLVAAGGTDAISALPGFSAEAGGKAVRLAVSGAFHSPLMSDASEGLAKELAQYTLRTPAMPLYSNVTAQPYGAGAAELIARQAKSPVLWQKTIENMISDGFDLFIEAGPGTTLCGLIHRISTKVAAFGVENPDSLEEAVRMISEGKHA
ncbi:ACP S-malonyltransferase [Caproicibacter fermentans]|uniref:Malonyl CoA-acyl carrier protein transacylase n=1 Tax=Caproicibacter fermentans TaxID=2576756 RepID=A0A7G8TBJ5_9FIRM|nr:ACP S-malonyltransferase [Caproicibacter fermentans]QNK40986.1 ACP S-malonyltransferase [Caproicibacter fermentans]